MLQELRANKKSRRKRLSKEKNNMDQDIKVSCKHRYVVGYSFRMPQPFFSQLTVRRLRLPHSADMAFSNCLRACESFGLFAGLCRLDVCSDSVVRQHADRFNPSFCSAHSGVSGTQPADSEARQVGRSEKEINPIRAAAIFFSSRTIRSEAPFQSTSCRSKLHRCRSRARGNDRERNF